MKSSFFHLTSEFRSQFFQKFYFRKSTRWLTFQLTWDLYPPALLVTGNTSIDLQQWSIWATCGRRRFAGWSALQVTSSSWTNLLGQWPGPPLTFVTILFSKICLMSTFTPFRLLIICFFRSPSPFTTPQTATRRLVLRVRGSFNRRAYFSRVPASEKSPLHSVRGSPTARPRFNLVIAFDLRLM